MIASKRQSKLSDANEGSLVSDSREKEGRRDLRAAAESVAQDGHAAFCAPAKAGEWALLLGLAIDVLGDAIHALAEAAQEQLPESLPKHRMEVRLFRGALLLRTHEFQSRRGRGRVHCRPSNTGSARHWNNSVRRPS